MLRATFLIGLMIVPLLGFAVPTASAYPNCDVGTGEFGVGVACAGGPGAFGVCMLMLYDTNTAQWAFPGGYACI